MMSAMKRVILSYIFIFIALATAGAQDSTNVQTDSTATTPGTVIAENKSGTGETVLEEANALYNSGDFRKAIEILENEKDAQKSQGLESAGLYYNLGNSYFRVNEIAKARLYYERALLLDPGDRDTRHNIDYVMSKIEDKIPVADTFFLNIWFNAIQNLFSSNSWATIGVVSFILFVLCLVLFFFSRYIFTKKAAFYTGIVLIIVVIFANIFSFRQKSRIEHRDTAIIMAASVPMVSSPDINSKELTLLHAGTKVTVTKEDRSWLEVEIDNGTVGWIQREKLEII
jgi:tetratricopeptide (TPR) repeat protein